jgi:hypothetical protein
VLFTESLLSNRSTCCIARMNSLQAYCHFFSSEGYTCDICDRSHLPSPWLSSHGNYSPTALAAPSLRPLIPSGSGFKPVQVYHHEPQCEVVLLTSLVLEGAENPPQCAVTSRNPMGILTTRFTTSSLKVCLMVLFIHKVALLGLSIIYSFMHSICVQHLFLNVRPLGAPHTTMSLAQCRNSMAGQPSSGSNQLVPRPTITLGPFLRLSVAPDG